MSRDRGRTPLDDDYGLGEHTIDCDALGLIDEEELSARLIRAFEAPDYRPPRLPTVAMELVGLTHNPNVEFRDLEALLEKDAMLAGQVFSISRSAFYSGTGEVNSLHSAVVRLGLDKLREVLLQAALNLRVFRCETYKGVMDRLRHHSAAVSHFSRIISRYTPIDEERAFLAGLMHDVGIAGILLTLADTERGKQPPDLAVLWPAIDGAHASAGAKMVKLWELPAEISMAVGAHHQVSIDGFDHPLAATVCLAEALATELQVAFVPSGTRAAALDPSGLATHGHIDRTDEAIVERAKEALQITPSTLGSIRADVEAWQAEGIEVG